MSQFFVSGGQSIGVSTSTSVISFLPRSKHLLISWLQSPSAVILEPQKIKSDTVYHSISHDFMESRWGNMETETDFILGVPKSLQMVTAAMKFKDTSS